MKSEDKQLDSPFNTYKNSGLPPHPIANPSLDSIEAARLKAEEEKRKAEEKAAAAAAIEPPAPAPSAPMAAPAPAEEAPPTDTGDQMF
mgnify:CR=1 FL=1